MNCIEDLPVFGAIVFALEVGQVSSPLVDVCFEHSNAVASWRFGFFFVQFIASFWLIGLIVMKFAGAA